MKCKKILSLCLPTNGIKEWVHPVLESIYNQNVDEELYEVIVTDNGDNKEFYNFMMEYATKHQNLIYKRNKSFMFDNQIETLKLASGIYYKFLNHRSLILPGALENMISIILENKENRPIIYFSNGTLEKDYYLSTFDEFIKNLRRYVSWTTGVGIWAEDYKNIDANIRFDKISPHSAILFAEKKRSEYRIYNNEFCKEITNSHKNKGTYDLFKAFSIEEVEIVTKLYIDGDISIETLKYVKEDYQKFVSELYWNFCIRNEPCSYDLSGFDNAMGIYFNKIDIVLGAYGFGVKAAWNKIRNGIRRKNDKF